MVPLQLCPGIGPGRPHFALQAEEQQRPHVAGGRFAGCVWEKGDLTAAGLVLLLFTLCSRLCREDSELMVPGVI